MVALAIIAVRAIRVFWDGIHRRLELPLCRCCGHELRAVCLCRYCLQAMCRTCLRSCSPPTGVAEGGGGGVRL